MDDVLHEFGRWSKIALLFAVLGVMAVLNAMMLYDVFGGDLLFAGMGLVFFSVASWVYLANAFGLKSEKNGKSKTQIVLIWVGVAFTLAVEGAMAVFELLRMQTLFDIPPWLNFAIMGAIVIAMVFHAVTGVVFYAAGLGYNASVHKIFENSRRASAEEDNRKALERAAIDGENKAAEEAMRLAEEMVYEAVPFIAMQRAPQLADSVLRQLGLEGDIGARAAVDFALKRYKDRLQTDAAVAMRNGIIDAPSRPAEPADARQYPADTGEALPTNPTTPR
jgi:hypothetical protein